MVNNSISINEQTLYSALIEIKLHVNQMLYQKGFLTDEMYTKAKEIILKDDDGKRM